MFVFPILFPNYRNSLFLCFGDNTTGMKTNKKMFISDPIFTQSITWNSLVTKLTYFVAEPNLTSTFQIPCNKIMEISTVQRSRQCMLQQCFNIWNIPLKMAIGFCLKIDPSRLQQKWFHEIFHSFWNCDY